MSALEQRLLIANSRYHVGHEAASLWSRNKSISSTPDSIGKSTNLREDNGSNSLIAQPVIEY